MCDPIFSREINVSSYLFWMNALEPRTTGTLGARLLLTKVNRDFFPAYIIGEVHCVSIMPKGSTVVA